MQNNKSDHTVSKKPQWLKSKISSGKTFFDIQKKLKEKNLVTVCEEAKCPNISECWNRATATFMVLGDMCTRACRFCHIKTGNPNSIVDKNEIYNVAKSCSIMNLDYVVLTMVDRDDLLDGGAAHVAKVICEIRKLNPNIKIEILAGDFRGDQQAIKKILESEIDVYAHNIETIERLTPKVRDARASYSQSLQALSYAKKESKEGLYTKSSIMLGLGETFDEVIQAMKDLRKNQVDFLTLGQYMRPTKKHLTVKNWIPPKVFKKLEDDAYSLGFKGVASGPLVRSSYKAREFYEASTKKNIRSTC